MYYVMQTWWTERRYLVERRNSPSLFAKHQVLRLSLSLSSSSSPLVIIIVDNVNMANKLAREVLIHTHADTRKLLDANCSSRGDVYMCRCRCSCILLYGDEIFYVLCLYLHCFSQYITNICHVSIHHAAGTYGQSETCNVHFSRFYRFFSRSAIGLLYDGHEQMHNGQIIIILHLTCQFFIHHICSLNSYHYADML